MESVDPFDKYLDPLEESPYSECDYCGDIFDNNNLTEIDGLYLCDDCLIDYQEEKELENLEENSDDSEEKDVL